MVVNVLHHFIFIHVPKAAGTSLAASLSALPGNHTRWLAKTKHETLADFRAHVAGRMSPTERTEGPDPLAFFTCAFVRNPWDRMASLYRYLVERRPRPEIDSVRSFKDLLLQAHEGVAWITGLHSLRQQVDFFTLPFGERRLGYLGHSEHLVEDATMLATRLGCPFEVPHLNRTTNADGDYRRLYDTEMIDLVGRLFPDDVRHLGYRFDTRQPVNRLSGGIPPDDGGTPESTGVSGPHGRPT